MVYLNFQVQQLCISLLRTILVPDTSPAVFCKFLETLYGEVMDTKSLTTEQLIEMMILTDIYEVI